MLVKDNDTIEIVRSSAAVQTKTEVRSETFDQAQDRFDEGTRGPVNNGDGSWSTTTIAYSADGKTKTTTVTRTWDSAEEQAASASTSVSTVNLRNYLLASESVQAALRNGAFGDYNKTGTNNVKFYAMNENKDVFMAVYGDGVEFLGFFALGAPDTMKTSTTTTDGNTTTTTESMVKQTSVSGQYKMAVSDDEDIVYVDADFNPGADRITGTYQGEEITYDGRSGSIAAAPTLTGKNGTEVSYHPYTLTMTQDDVTETQTVWIYWIGDLRFTAAVSPYLKIDSENYFEINETLDESGAVSGPGTVNLTAKTTYITEPVYVTKQNEDGDDEKVQLYEEEYVRAKNEDGSLATEEKTIQAQDENKNLLTEYVFDDTITEDPTDKIYDIFGNEIQRKVYVKQATVDVIVDKLDDYFEPEYETVTDEKGNKTEISKQTTMQATYYRLATTEEIAEMEEEDKIAAIRYLKCEAVKDDAGNVLYYQTVTTPVTVTQTVAKYDLIKTPVTEEIATRQALEVALKASDNKYTITNDNTVSTNERYRITTIRATKHFRMFFSPAAWRSFRRNVKGYRRF